MRWFFSFLIFVTTGAVVYPGTLTLAESIPLPEVNGRIDHLSVDVAGHRLFVAALGNNTVEVLDLNQGKVIHSISGLDEPQGLAYIPESNLLYVANGGNGAVRVFDGNTFALLTVLKFPEDADNVRYDDKEKKIYVGYGKGAIGVVDAVQQKIVGDIPVSGHPESFQMEKAGPRIWVNIPNSHEVAVLDREKKGEVGRWNLRLMAGNFTMGVDEANRRVFVGCRFPPRLLVFDADSGKDVARLDLHRDCDDVIYDPRRKQIYISCGEGYLDIFTQADADHYSLKEAVKTVARARTCCFDGDKLYLAIPKRGGNPAEIRCYSVEP